MFLRLSVVLFFLDPFDEYFGGLFVFLNEQADFQPGAFAQCVYFLYVGGVFLEHVLDGAFRQAEPCFGAFEEVGVVAVDVSQLVGHLVGLPVHVEGIFFVVVDDHVLRSCRERVIKYANISVVCQEVPCGFEQDAALLYGDARGILVDAGGCAEVAHGLAAVYLYGTNELREVPAFGVFFRFFIYVLVFFVVLVFRKVFLIFFHYNLNIFSKSIDNSKILSIFVAKRFLEEAESFFGFTAKSFRVQGRGIVFCACSFSWTRS